MLFVKCQCDNVKDVCFYQLDFSDRPSACGDLFTQTIFLPLPRNQNSLSCLSSQWRQKSVIMRVLCEEVTCIYPEMIMLRCRIVWCQLEYKKKVVSGDKINCVFDRVREQWNHWKVVMWHCEDYDTILCKITNITCSVKSRTNANKRSLNR